MGKRPPASDREKRLIDEVSQCLLSAPDKGALLERVTEGLLKDAGALEVRRQLSGSQFGFDIWARVPNRAGEVEIWKVECKNVRRPLTLEEVAPKLIWQSASTTIDRFVVVGTSPPANDLVHFLESHPYSFPIDLWTSDTLFTSIAASTRALTALGIKGPPGSSPSPARTFLPSGPLSFDLVHTQSPPRQFAYFRHTGGSLVKSFTNLEFKLHVLLGNRGTSDVIVTQLRCRTVAYAEKGSSRVVIQTKAKGIFEPEKLTYRPSTLTFGDSEVLAGKVVKVAGGALEILRMELAEDTLPGAYQLQFFSAATGVRGSYVVASPIFCVLVLAGREDTVHLHTFGRHYDDPVERILDLSEREWRTLGDLHAQGKWLWIGPLPDEVVRRESAVGPWAIRAQDAPEPDGTLRTSAETIVALPGPVGEPMYSVDDAGARVTGRWEPDRWLPDQLERRRRQRIR
jgi:hypothetical protein